MKKNVRMLATGGLIIALDVVCTRFLYFYTPGNVDRISLQFVPNALAGLVFGPFWAMLITVMGDVVGMIINSSGMAFMPLISLACAARGLIYGLFLHKRPLTAKRCVLAVAVVTVVVELGIMPINLAMLYGEAWSTIIVPKLLTRFITIPVYGLTLYSVTKAMQRAGVPAVKDAIRTGK
ncbi:MAG: folate family ECF transporter S component [Clostridiales bacterium]|jgi:ECF transporter S component (folate family)|nr:folate family ECF transporter S component [Clostridiales bacterium]